MQWTQKHGRVCWFFVVYIGEVAEAEVAVSIFFLSASSRNLMGTMTDVRTCTVRTTTEPTFLNADTIIVFELGVVVKMVIKHSLE
jgi:hypothetical protein